MKENNIQRVCDGISLEEYDKITKAVSRATNLKERVDPYQIEMKWKDTTIPDVWVKELTEGERYFLVVQACLRNDPMVKGGSEDANEKVNASRESMGVEKVDPRMVNYWGFKGEYAVSEFLGLKLGITPGVRSDLGKDCFYNGVSIDVKYRNSKDGYLYFKEPEQSFKADIAVLTVGDKSSNKVYIVGWVWRKEFLNKMEKRTLGMAMEAPDLHRMSRLREMARPNVDGRLYCIRSDMLRLEKTMTGMGTDISEMRCMVAKMAMGENKKEGNEDEIRNHGGGDGEVGEDRKRVLGDRGIPVQPGVSGLLDQDPPPQEVRAGADSAHAQVRGRRPGADGQTGGADPVQAGDGGAGEGGEKDGDDPDPEDGKPF